MAAFRLRPARLDDQAAVTGLLDASYGTLMPAAYGKALTADLLPIIRKAKAELLTSGTYYLAVAAEGEIVGAGGWTRERPGTGEIEPDTGHIRHVAAHPDWAGKGVGRTIIDHAVAEARSAGIRRFECYSSLNAVDFYTRLGFVTIGPIDIPMGGDLVMPSIVMEQRL